MVKVGEDEFALCSREEDDEDGTVELGVGGVGRRGEDTVPRPEGEVRFTTSWRCTARLWSPGPRMGFDAQYFFPKHKPEKQQSTDQT
jgi:hypothetical protein